MSHLEHIYGESEKHADEKDTGNGKYTMRKWSCKLFLLFLIDNQILGVQELNKCWRKLVRL